tara:strand:- start:230 stop:1273 length:1044 start_codon:yes stop_codon:yes gene_type:complete
MQGSLNQFQLRIFLFLVVILLVIVLLYPVLITAFLSNIYINSVIVALLLFGIAYCLYQFNILQNDYNVLANFNIHKSPQILKDKKGLIKNFIYEIIEKDGRYSFKSSRISKMLESIDINLLSIRETSRYFVGLLVFLGLLGTFWGLLKTIGSVGNVISGLGIDDANLAGFFNNLKEGLQSPLEGMSIAFSSSLLGLAGSLILGFVDLQLGQAQSKFSQFAEKILLDNSSPDFINQKNSLDKTTLNSIQKIYDNLENLVYTVKESSKSHKEIIFFIQSVTENIKDLTNITRDQEKKMSNFLSAQLNTQSSILELSTKLSNEGVLDKKTKLHLQNIDKGIKFLATKIKK